MRKTATLPGSSPLARGTLGARTATVAIKGLIPARAGNTVFAVVLPIGDGAHPRSRGEHCVGRVGAAGDPGSSPLARGTQAIGMIVTTFTGLIPARAGNTSSSCSYGGIVRAHPRSRGEHMSFEQAATRRKGSSPLARGTLKPLVSFTVCRGLIPARAGNTKPNHQDPRRRRAHPRSRGEHLVSTQLPLNH